MKKVLITLTLLLTLGMTTEMVAQKHRHTPQAKELVDSTSKDAVEVYSDTTSASTTAVSPFLLFGLLTNIFVLDKAAERYTNVKLSDCN